MKSSPVILIVLMVAASVIWGFWSHQHRPVVATVSPQRTPTPFVAATPRPFSPGGPVNPWQEYHEARQKTLADNPELAAEYQSLLTKIAQQEEKLNAAMIQADPKVAPIIAKLAAARQQSAPSGTASPIINAARSHP